MRITALPGLLAIWSDHPSLRQVKGRAVVMVTHDPRVPSYGDRILHLEDGRLVREEAAHHLTAILKHFPPAQTTANFSEEFPVEL